MNENKTTEKMTYAKALTAVLNGEPLTAEISEKLTALLHSVEKKNSADKKPTAQQTANEGIKAAILEAMEPDTLYTVTDLLKSVPACAELTNQRVSALLRQMKEDGLVQRTEDKRKAFFSKV